MSGSKKFFVLFISVLMLLICASSSLAITSITSTLTPTSYTDRNEPILKLNQGETFSFNLTAENPVGEIHWTLSYSVYDYNSGEYYLNSYGYDAVSSSDGNINISSIIGNTVNVNGTLSHYEYIIVAKAEDIGDENSTAIYVCIIRNNTSTVYSERNSGDSWEDAYMINSVADFKLMRYKSFVYIPNNYGYWDGDGYGKYYKLGADLDLTSESSWDSFYLFGHFDGQGHTIRYNTNRDTEHDFQHSALFYEVSGDILNLNVKGTVRGNFLSAGIVNYFEAGTIENCTFEGTVETESLGNVSIDISYAAGIVNYHYAGTIKNCTFSGTVSAISKTEYGASSAGGITNLVAKTIDNCNVLAGSSINAISNTASFNYSVAGGIAGYAPVVYEDEYFDSIDVIYYREGSITNCTSNADVNSSQWAGGIIGTVAYNEFILSGNTWPSQYQEVGAFIGEAASNSNDVEVASIAPIELDDDVISQLASNIGVDPSEIRLLTSEDIIPGTPPDPTEEMKQEAARQNYQFAAKFNTINVSEDGYYVFQVTVPDELVGLSVSSLKIMFGEESDYYSRNIEISRGIKGVRDISKIKDFKHSVRPAFFMELVNGLTGTFEVTNFLGMELDTLPKKFLATMFLSAGESLTVYLLKTILQLLLAVCNIGIASGGVILVGGLILIKFFRRKR